MSKNKDVVNKQQLIDEVSKSLPTVSSQVVEKSFEIMLEELSTALACGDRIEIRGFGSLVVRKRPKGLVRNPKSGDKVIVGARGSLYFRASKDLIKMLNNNVAN
jgi:integration host factor subunit beta